MANYLVTDTDLTAVANAIRTKGETSEPLSFPDEFVEAIADIPSGGSSIDEAQGMTVYVRWMFETDMDDLPSEPVTLEFYNQSGTKVYSKTLTVEEMFPDGETDRWVDFSFQHTQLGTGNYAALYVKFVTTESWDHAVNFESVSFNLLPADDEYGNINSTSIQDRMASCDWNNTSYGGRKTMTSGAANTNQEFADLGHLSTGATTTSCWNSNHCRFLKGSSYYFED